MSKVCTKCGSSNSSGDSFCWTCGEFLALKDPTTSVVHDKTPKVPAKPTTIPSPSPSPVPLPSTSDITGRVITISGPVEISKAPPNYLMLAISLFLSFFLIILTFRALMAVPLLLIVVGILVYFSFRIMFKAFPFFSYFFSLFAFQNRSKQKKAYFVRIEDEFGKSYHIHLDGMFHRGCVDLNDKITVYGRFVRGTFFSTKGYNHTVNAEFRLSQRS